jgi:hypothetical protein
MSTVPYTAGAAAPFYAFGIPMADEGAAKLARKVLQVRAQWASGTRAGGGGGWLRDVCRFAQPGAPLAGQPAF